MYFGTENIPLSSSGGNLLQYLTSLMITFWIYPGYNLFKLVTLYWITADRLQCALDLNITIFQAGGLSAWRPGGVSAWRLVLRRLVHRRDVPWRLVLWRGVLWRQRP